MSEYDLPAFIDDARRVALAGAEPADCVLEIAPLMQKLLMGDRSFLEARHFRADPDHYARNAIHVTDDGGPSLYALVWTYLVQRRSGFTPVPVEQVLEQEFARSGSFH